MKVLIHRHNAPHPARGNDGVGRAVDALLWGYSQLGVDVDFYNTHPKNEYQEYFESIYKGHVRVVKKYQDDDYDIINFHGDLPEDTKWGKKHVRTLHWVVVGQEITKLMQQNVHTVVGVSEACMRGNGIWDQGQQDVVHSALYLDSVHKREIQTRIRQKDDYYIWLGGTDWAEQKGLFSAIQVAKTLNIRLLIYGDGQNQEVLSALAQAQTNKIKYMGPTKGDADKYDIMARSRGLLYPTLIPDGCPMTVIEALSCGCPVFCYDHSALPEIMESGLGFMSETGNLRMYIKNIAMSNHTSWDYAKIAMTAQLKFDPLKAAKQYLAIYNKILNI